MLKIYPHFKDKFSCDIKLCTVLAFVANSNYIALPMRKLFHLYLVCTIALLSSCKTLRNVTAKDNSVSRGTKQNNNPGTSVFLDDISVTPGSKSTTVSTADTKKTYGPSVNSSDKNFDNSTAFQLQTKYASLLNVPLEELSNTTLLLTIDYWWGTKYCLGGSTENCIDCSAFTQTILRDVYSITIPRTAQEQYDISERIKTKELQQGDLVFFENTKHRVTHVGVYVANNKFVHASVSNGVMISDLDDEYWKKRYKAAGRVLK